MLLIEPKQSMRAQAGFRGERVRTRRGREGERSIVNSFRSVVCCRIGNRRRRTKVELGRSCNFGRDVCAAAAAPQRPGRRVNKNFSCQSRRKMNCCFRLKYLSSFSSDFSSVALVISKLHGAGYMFGDYSCEDCVRLSIASGHNHFVNIQEGKFSR